MNFRLSLFEKSILAFVTLIVILAFAFFYTAPSLLNFYLGEDGIVEWLTVIGLLIGFGLCVDRLIRLRKKKSWWFLAVTFVLAALLFVAAGEEISWGQRIFNIQSPDYFKKNNAQGETNIHNLVVNGVKINRLVFSVLLIICLSVYLIVVPLVYNYSAKMKSFFDRSGIPVVRTYQVITIVILFAVSALLKHHRNPEVLEAGATLLFSLIIYNPKNRYIFSDQSNSPS